MTGISYSNEYTIREAKKEDAFPETFSHWNRIKNRIKSIEQRDPFYQTAIGVLIGIAITAVFGLNSLPKDTPVWLGMPLFFIYLAASIGCIFAAISFAYFDRKQKGLVNTTKEDIIAEMESIEERFKMDVSAGEYYVNIDSIWEPLKIGNGMADAFSYVFDENAAKTKTPRATKPEEGKDRSMKSTGDKERKR